MPTIAYLANIFPSSAEPYVLDEIRELRKRGISVIACSALQRTEPLNNELQPLINETLYLEPLRFWLCVQAGCRCIRDFPRLKDFFFRGLQRRKYTERRLPALVHSFLGVYYALLLRKFHVGHIHVHHGYFGCWLGMVAARVLQIPFTMTLHGSDLLVHAAYLDKKLAECQFCITISEFNRQHILKSYPEIDAAKIHVVHVGVDCGLQKGPRTAVRSEESPFKLLAVGRLHAIKDHAFLVRACHLLKIRGLRFVCCIAGDGPERHALEVLIGELHLEREVRLLGNLSRHQLADCYENADLIVLTSRSEGIPLVLMEAMAHSKIVLAPAITGIPELVMDGKNGFLYQAGSLHDFISRVEFICRAHSSLTAVGRNAREYILQDFDRGKNLSVVCDLLLTNLHDRPTRVAIAA